MSDREKVISLAERTLEMLRSYCEIEADDGFVEFEDGWSFATPIGLFEFRMVRYLLRYKLNLRLIGKTASQWQTIANVKNKEEGRKAMLLFLRGINP